MPKILVFLYSVKYLGIEYKIKITEKYT